MAKKIRSAKGQMVDFELFKIKESLGSSPTPVEVKARERFIENKMKRKLKRAKNEMLENMKENKEEPKAEQKDEQASKRKIRKNQNNETKTSE